MWFLLPATRSAGSGEPTEGGVGLPRQTLCTSIGGIIEAKELAWTIRSRISFVVASTIGGSADPGSTTVPAGVVDTDGDGVTGPNSALMWGWTGLLTNWAKRAASCASSVLTGARSLQRPAVRAPPAVRLFVVPGDPLRRRAANSRSSSTTTTWLGPASPPTTTPSPRANRSGVRSLATASMEVPRSPTGTATAGPPPERGRNQGSTSYISRRAAAARSASAPKRLFGAAAGLLQTAPASSSMARTA